MAWGAAGEPAGAFSGVEGYPSPPAGIRGCADTLRTQQPNRLHAIVRGVGVLALSI
jgi:hypothetical protein